MKRSRGFTLLEVLVAMTLLALLMSAVLPALQTGMTALRSGDDRLRALLLAQSLLAEHTSDTGEAPDTEQQSTGADPLPWRIERAPYEGEDAIGPIDPEGPFRLTRVTVFVAYGSGSSEVRLSTLSLEQVEAQ